MHGLCVEHCSFFLLYIPSISMEKVAYFEMGSGKKGARDKEENKRAA
jgi:hypothetical protein